MAAPYKASVCGRSLARIAGSNPAGVGGGRMSVPRECGVLSEVSVTDRSLVQRSPIECMCVFVCVCLSLSVITCSSNTYTYSECEEGVRIRKKQINIHLH